MCTSQDDTTTQNEAEDCCAVGEGEPTTERQRTDWLDGNVLDQQLPAELRTTLGRFFGTDSVDTLGEWGNEIRRVTDGDAIDIDQLCHADAETNHWGEVDGKRYHFQCFYDAVLLAALEERPVDVHTVSPAGSVVEARAVGTDELSVTPEGAVFSLGIALEADQRSGGDPTLHDGYAAICPYVRAFPDRDAYQTWADDVPAATVATPLAGATGLATALVA